MSSSVHPQELDLFKGTIVPEILPSPLLGLDNIPTVHLYDKATI
jgi:hypothetical protein